MAIQDVIKGQVTQNRVVLYMKGTPDFPQCGFSAKTVGILLGRLVERGFLRSVTGPIPPRGRPALIYFPLVSRREALRRQFELFFENHLIEAEEDLEFLEALIEERRAQAAKNG